MVNYRLMMSMLKDPSVGEPKELIRIRITARRVEVDEHGGRIGQS